MKKSRTIGTSRPLGGLPTLVLAGALCLLMLGQALADFESAVADFERGAYEEARKEFMALATEGDERVDPYLKKIREFFTKRNQTDAPFVSNTTDSNRSVLSGPSTLTASPSPKGGSGSAAAEQDASSLSDPSTNTGPPPDNPNILVPGHRSIWSAIFYLPGDATVIGLLYVTRFLDAANLRRELQYLSHHSNLLALGLLAGFWWLVITRGVVGIGASIIRFMKTVAKQKEQTKYG